MLRRRQPQWPWRTIRWKEGTKGWLRARFIANRCWRVDGQGVRHVGWLIGQRPTRGETGDWKYLWSDFPPQTPLPKMVEYFHRQLADWLRSAAIRELVAKNLIDQFCSRLK
jgi:hypothetical protein